MKLDSKTVEVLKSFSTINPSILVKVGNVLQTISPTKTLMAKAVVKDSFDKEFALFDVSRFLAVLSLFKEPEVKLYENNLEVVGSGKRVSYAYCDKDSIVVPPNKEIKLPSVDVQFDVTEEQLAEVSKARGILGHPDVVFVGANGKVMLQAIDVKRPTDDIYSVDVGTTEATFMAVFKPENLKLLPANYSISISKKGISHWKASEELQYFVAVEGTSTYE